MKKVIGVLLFFSLFAGMAFAEVSVYLNARLRSNMYHFTKDKNGNKETYTFDLNGASAHGGSDVMADTLGFTAKTDYAGIKLELTEKELTDEVDVSDVDTTKKNRDVSVGKAMVKDAKWSG